MNLISNKQKIEAALKNLQDGLANGSIQLPDNGVPVDENTNAIFPDSIIINKMVYSTAYDKVNNVISFKS